MQQQGLVIGGVRLYLLFGTLHGSALTQTRTYLLSVRVLLQFLGYLKSKLRSLLQLINELGGSHAGCRTAQPLLAYSVYARLDAS